MKAKEKLSFFSQEIAVRFCEVDQLKVVWHGNYLKYFEIARDEFLQSKLLSFQDLVEQGYTGFIIRSELYHKKPAVYGDIIRVEISLLPCRTCKLIFYYRIFNQAGHLLCEGQTEQVLVDRKGDLVLAWPEFLVNWMQKALGAPRE